MNFFKLAFQNFKNPTPPEFSFKNIEKFLYIFYGVCMFEIFVFICLWILYPNKFLFFQYFFSELGAPITKLGIPNNPGMILFSVNMGIGALGTLSFIPLIAKLFPHPKNSFYSTVRYINYCCIVLLSIGNIFVALPYTTYWIPHVLGGFLCIFSLWGIWCMFILFNTKWSLLQRVCILVILNLFCAFVFFSILLKWHMELLQKPGQGLVSAIVIIWPLVYYSQIKKNGTN